MMTHVVRSMHATILLLHQHNHDPNDVDNDVIECGRNDIPASEVQLAQ
jgi:hypothetical protein